MPEPLEHLAHPPIVEVVCGVKFEPLANFDPVVLGAYWSQRANEFPQRQLHEPLQDAGEIMWSASPLVRVWFVSPSDGFLLQFQHDRFYLNWRRIPGGEYPRFKDNGPHKGVLSRMLAEFDQYAAFCEAMLGATLKPVRCELTKIDHLVEAQHWTNRNDLVQLVPLLGATAKQTRSERAMMTLQYGDQRDDSELLVTLRTPAAVNVVNDRGGMDTRTAAILETRVLRAVRPPLDLRAEFEAANELTNVVFTELIPPAERNRFAVLREMP